MDEDTVVGTRNAGFGAGVGAVHLRPSTVDLRHLCTGDVAPLLSLFAPVWSGMLAARGKEPSRGCGDRGRGCQETPLTELRPPLPGLRGNADSERRFSDDRGDWHFGRESRSLLVAAALGEQRQEDAVKYTDDYEAKLKIWVQEAKVWALPEFTVPSFPPQRFNSHEEMNTWKRDLLRRIAEQGGIRWKT